MKYVLSGVGEVKDLLGDIVPLIGFCGAPFTLACYLIEGGGSWNFSKIKRFLYDHPRDAVALLEHLAEMTGNYLKAQIDAGADAVQLFDSWGGILPPEYYKKYSLPYIKTVFDMCKIEGVPRILYLNNSAPYLKLLSDLDCEVVGIDWRTNAGDAARILDGKAIQGNLDPQLLFAPKDLLYDETMQLLKSTEDLDGFIFNLGHGIMPDTPIESVRFLVDTVHSFSRQ
jgi:uroporphyrinogen decarboxylase